MRLKPLDPHINTDPDATFILPTREALTELWLAGRGLGVSLGEWEIWRGRFLREVREVAVDEEDVRFLERAVEETPERFVDGEGRLMGLGEWIELQERAQGEE